MDNNSEMLHLSSKGRLLTPRRSFMRKTLLTLATIMLISQFSLAMAADPNLQQIQPRQMPQQGSGNIPQLQLTPDLLYKQITALQQQIANLQGQVNALRSVIQVSQNGTTIQAENLVVTAGNTLTLLSGKGTNLNAGDNLTLRSGKDLSLQSQKDVMAEGAARIKLKAPQINFNDGTQPLAMVGSAVSGGKVINGSVSVFAK